MNEEQANYCSDCGKSLRRLQVACLSSPCGDCGKETFYARYAENGGLRVEAGENLHLPSMSFSLDPSNPGRFFRAGLQAFLKSL